MPEEVLPEVASNSAKNRSLTKVLLIFGLAVVFLLVGLFVASNLIKKSSKDVGAVSGLSRDSIKLGWADLEGIYPDYAVQTSDDSDFNDSIFEALTKVRGNSVLPSLATQWTNPSSTVWRFKIRPNVTFQSGDKLTAADVKYSFDQVINSIGTDNEWPSSGDVATIKEVRVIDPLTVEIETNKPDPLLINRITSIYILSQKQIERDGLSKAVGTGPYRLLSFEKDKQASVVVNETYWGEKPKVKKATFIIYQTDGDLLAALSRGDIDYARLHSANTKIPSGFDAKIVESPRVVMLLFNFNAVTVNGKANPLLNLKVRQAIDLTLDKKQIIKEASVSGQPASQFLTKSLVGYNKSLTVTQTNITKAKDLLSSAGVGKGFSFTIYVTPDRASTANALAKQLATISLTAQVKVLDNFSDIVKALQSGEAASFIASPTANDGGELIDGFFKTDSDNNIFGYSDPDVDKLAEAANADFKPEERKSLLENLVAKIMADQPLIPINTVTDTFVIKNSFNFSPNYLNNFNLETVSGQQGKTSNY